MENKPIKSKNSPDIPKGWLLKKLGEVACFQNGYSFKSTTYDKNGKYKIATITNIQDGYMDATYFNKISKLPNNLHPQQKLNKGDILITMTGNVGRVSRVAIANTLLNQRVGKIIPHHINKNFLYMVLRKKKFMFKMMQKMEGGGQGNLSKSDILRYEFLMPCSLVEQDAIATGLMAIDTLLQNVQALQAKKKNMKKSIMHLLLTAKQRLKPFTGKWVEKRLGEIAEMNSGGTPSTSHKSYYNGDIPWVVIADMTKANKYIADTAQSITTIGLTNSSALLFKAGSVMFSIYASIGKCSIAKVPLSCNQAILGITPKKVNNEFLYYYLTFKGEELATIGQTGTQNNLSKSIVKNIRIPTPTLPEQTAIAQSLTQLDEELDALDAKEKKYAQIKEGMMQQLLTGKIRLP